MQYAEKLPAHEAPTRATQTTYINYLAALPGKHLAHSTRKELTHMSIALRNKQIVALFILALVTVLVLATVIFSAVTHVNVWHAFLSSGLIPNGMYGH